MPRVQRYNVLVMLCMVLSGLKNLTALPQGKRARGVMPQNKEAAEHVKRDSSRQLPAARVALRVLNFQSRLPQAVHRSINASVHKAISGSGEEPRPARDVRQIVHLS